MSLSTSYRYEAMDGKKSLMKALERQKERIKYDEQMEARDNTVRLENNANLRAEWDENLEDASESKRMRENLSVITGEMRQANKATVAVRRAALKKLLEHDHQIYDKELHTQGKTFYVQRT